MKILKRASMVALSAITVFGTVLSYYPSSRVKAADEFRGRLQYVQSVVLDQDDHNIVYVNYNDDVTAKVTFLEDGIFRYNVDPSGKFAKYATPNARSHVAKIQQYPDESNNYSHPSAKVTNDEETYSIVNGSTTIVLDKDTATMKVLDGNKTVLEEKDALLITDNSTVQTLVANNGEDFYGGGTQNGRFIHTGEAIKIAIDNTWVDGSVTSPNPFYYSSNGYGVLRNTFTVGEYDFGKTIANTVTTTHNESEFDAYYFVSNGASNRAEVAQNLLQKYYHVTGNPALLAESGFYLGHLNCYNRDAWSNEPIEKKWTTKGSASSSSAGTSKWEIGRNKDFILSDGQNAETLNGNKPTVATDKYPDVETPYEFSAQAIMNGYEENDMPLGYFVPNDGYGCGYGQNGYTVQGGVNADGSSSQERLATVEANVNNLKEFTNYANSKGVQTGLWTESNLKPDSNSNTYWHRLRDFEKEVTVGGVTTLKTDVAWVGSGYSFALNGIKSAYDTISTGVGIRPTIISLDGWAGTQRFASIWTGDQHGGDWEYIRFHIPTYIGQSLAGNPNVASDMDGIFSGSPLIATRDYQWKAFTHQMLDMDGWGDYVKSPQTHGDPYTGISRMYLKLKAQLMPYTYTGAASSANIDTGNDDTALPLIRAMFLEFPNDDYAASKAMQYQYMYGDSFLVAPLYQNTNADATGNDIRNNIYLPDADQVWIDYFTGKQYRGGQSLNNFDAPLWKLPLFVKNGSIVPMYEEHNNPGAVTDTNEKGLDKANRKVEFWPAGTTEYTTYEDDGRSIENNTTTEDEYGVIDNVSYGDHVSTKFTSNVDGNTATLTAEKSTGTYKGYDKTKNTTFVVNVSKQPENVVAKNGNTELEIVTVDSKEAFDATKAEAGKAVYFYDANPSIETYAPEVETEIAAMVADVEVSPKLYVKFAETDTKENAQTLVINGFANEQDLGEDKLNTNLATPELTIPEEESTPTSISLNWTAVDGADSYELLVDGTVFGIGNHLSYKHAELAYNSTHTYQVRARNADGYSEWSPVQTAASLLDPWRNVPEGEVIKWDGGDSWGALENAFDHNISKGNMFHSTGDSIGKEMIIDYKKAYQLDKFEYYARNDNYGNGTVNRMTISTSLDGVHWTVVQDGNTQQRWTYNGNLSVEENKKVVDLKGKAARYVKLVVNESAGGFFSAAELALHKLDGTNGFEVGSSLMTPNVTAGDETNMKNYLGVANKEPDATTFLSQIKGHYADINENDVYDVYDYAFTAFKLDGGTTKTGKVAGDVLLLPNKENVKAGETFTIDVYASDVKNVNALGALIDYDTNTYEFKGIEKSPLISSMENYSVNKSYTDGSGMINVAFANKGDKELFTGTGIVATITLQAKVDTKALAPTEAIIIGPTFDFVETDTGNLPDIPDIPLVTTKEYKQSDFNITMTNDVLPEDNGTNVEKIVQSGTYNALFNGTNGREFEFKYYIPSQNNVLPDEVKLPTTMHFAFKTAKPLTEVNIYNPGPSTSNGYVTELNAVVTFEDNSTKEFNFTEGMDVFKLEINSDKKVKNVDITPIKSTGEAKTKDQEVVNDPVDNRMLTLGEIDFLSVETQEVTAVELGNNKTDIYVGDIAAVEATVKPNDIINPYYTVESSNPDVASIIKIADGNNIKYYVRGNGAGTADITVTSVGDPTKSATYTVTVTDGVDTTELLAAIENANSHSASIYTAESFAKLSAAITAAQDLLKGDYTKAQVIAATDAIEKAINGLVYRPVNLESLINKAADTVVEAIRATSECHPETIEDGEKENVLDYNESSYWHTDYINSVGMPQSLIFDLKDVYDLTDVTFLPRQNGTNGDIFKAEILVSTDDENYVSLGVFEFDNNGVTLKDRNEYKQLTFDTATARYVEFKILNSGGDRADQYASMSEIRFYGTPVTSVDKTELQKLYTNYLTLKEADYTAESWVPFSNAMADAKAVLDRADATQDEVNNAATTLENAKNALVEVVVETNKAALSIAIEMAGTVTQEQLDKVVPVVANEFKAALENAKNVYDNAKATQDEVDAAFDRLADVMWKLEFYKGDKALLQKLVNEIAGLTASDYSDSSWNALQLVLTEVNKVLADENAMQPEVDDAYTDLVKAFVNLRLKPNKDLLEDLINKANGLNKANYTAASWALFEEELNKANAILNDPEATEAQVNDAANGLTKAIAGLVANPSNPPVDNNTNNPGSTVKPGDTTVNATKTGDTTNMMYPLAGLAIASLVIYGNKKRKKAN